ncbi:MAG TPA: hypothetical protein VFK33_17445 [Bacillales bacterium]|nr:hypothetical protein [Bacillales bacterium]
MSLMNNHRLFFTLLKVMRRKLWMERAVSLFYSVLLAAVCAVAVWAVLGRFVVILHLDVKIWVTCGIGLVVWLAATVYRRPSWVEAARAFDSHGLDDRVVTMLGFLDDDSEMIRLQREDTLKMMKASLDDVKAQRIRWLYWKRAVPSVVVVGAVVIAFIYPNGVMKEAAKAEKENKIVSEKKKEVEQFVKKQRDEVKPKAKEELEALKKEVAKAREAGNVMDEMLEAEAKLAELRKRSAGSEQELRRMETKLKSAGLRGMASALRERDPAALRKRMKALKEKLSELDGDERKKLAETLREMAKAAGAAGGSTAKESTQALQGKLEKMMKAAGGLQALADAQRKLQEMARGLNRQMAAAGLAKPGKLAFGGGGGSMPMGSGQPSEGGSGAKSGGAGGKKSGSGKKGAAGGGGKAGGSGGMGGTGGGQGSGNGGGAGGSGGGSGTGGTGSGAAPGNGAGFGVGSRELLTVPKKLEGKVNKEVDTGELGKGKSTKQVAPQSPVLPGQVRPYEKVYGEYQSTYRQSMERMDLPGHLQSVVKNYFSDLNPDQ